MSNNFKARAWIVCLFITLSSGCMHIYGQVPGDIKFNHLTVEDGLSDNTVTCFLRDSRGLLWIGTKNGLNRYDGYDFTVFLEKLNNPNSIKGDWITDIVEDELGDLWISTANGTLNHYSYSRNTFTPVKLLADTSRSDIFWLIVKDLYLDNDGILWIAVLREGLIRYDIQKDQLKTYLATGNPGDLSSNLVASVAKDSKGNLWVLTNDGVLNKMEQSTGKFVQIPYTTNFMGNPVSVHSSNLKIDSQDRVWIMTQKSGLYIFYPDEVKFDHYIYEEGISGLSNNSVTDMIEIEHDIFWITTDHGGINHFNIKTGEFQNYLHNPDQPFSLSNNQIYTIYRDEQGIYWTGNYQGGVNYFTPIKNYFYHYKESSDSQGLSKSSVLTFIERKNGEVWIGTDGGGINVLQPLKDGSYKIDNKPILNSRLSGNIIASLVEDSQGRIWAGTYLEGLNRYDPGTDELVIYSPNNSTQGVIADPSVWCMMEDSKNRIWIGSLGSGLYLFDPAINKFHQFAYDVTDGSGTSGRAIAYIYEDRRGTVWIAPSGSGLDRFNETDSSFTNFRPINNDTSSISSNSVQYIYEDSAQNLWIATLNGLNLLNRETGEFIRYSTRDGLPNNALQALLEDKQGNIWITTLNGLCRFNPTTKATRNYFSTDGLLTHQFAYKSCLMTRSGQFFLGGVAGVTAFHPDSLPVKEEFPDVIITDFKLFNKSVDIGPNSPLGENIIGAQSVRLNYDQNFISFSYTALDFLRKDKIYYAYYMEGLEKQWNYVGALRTASYTDLKPGKYIFHVQAASENGQSAPYNTSLAITIQPPYWQTWWFRIITIIFLVSGLISIYLLRIANLKKQKIQLQKMVAEKTQELSQKNRLLSEQTNALSETNSLLEERQMLIEEQSEELSAQKDDLAEKASALEKVNIRLEELNRTKDRFFSIIAHDLKSPFTSIIGFAELLNVKKDTLTKERREMFVNSIYTSARNLYNLLENLLLWSRSQSDRIKLEPTEIKLKGMVEANTLLLRNKLQQKEITTVINIHEDHCIIADQYMLDTIIRNLLSNAVKYTPPGGTITITSKIENGTTIVSVRDTGLGIAEEVMKDLLRIDKSVSTEGTNGEKGTGLGLILCKEFIEKHQGELSIESKINEGSIFTFSIPGKN